MITDLVLRDGDDLHAFGQVIVTSAGGARAWFEPLLAEPAVARSGDPGPPQPNPFGVPAEGVDPGMLANVRTFPGVTCGIAALHGTWRNEAVHVTTADPFTPGARNDAKLPSLLNGMDQMATLAAVSLEEVEAWNQELAHHVQSWLLLEWGGQHPGEPTVRLPVTAARVTSPLADWCDALPAGTVRVGAWLWPRRLFDEPPRGRSQR